MRTRIYFVRHAQSDFSVKDDLTRPLTGDGQRAAQQIVDTLSEKNIHAIFSSPCMRAIHTVQPFADKHGYTVTVEDGFAERNIGAWVDDFHSFSTKQWADFQYKLENGESLGETQARNIATLQKILQEHPNQNIVIGTHGTALSTIVNYYYPSHGYDYFVSIVDKMPYILCLTFHDVAIEWMEEVELSFVF